MSQERPPFDMTPPGRSSPAPPPYTPETPFSDTTASSQSARGEDHNMNISFSAPISTTELRPEAVVHEKEILSGADDVTPGRLSSDVYNSVLPSWRAAVRARLLKNVEWESHVVAKMQEHIRTPWLDAFFVYTSSLGTHTFFMTALPAVFWFGYDRTGRGILVVLALGVYLSSVIKDLFCSPRPFAPPVTRLTIGSHHLEYGFPSTHSTNSISIALFIFSEIRERYLAPPDSELSSISPLTYYVSCVLLFIYAFSIVFGRLYTAMHSFTDCACGILLGTAIWLVQYVYGASMEQWLIQDKWRVPLAIVPLCLFLVHKHPQPVDDCPCFEDAIAFMAVIMGSFLARWYSVHFAFAQEVYLTRPMPGSTWSTWEDVGLWCLFAAAKMAVGVPIIFTWRIFAKKASHMILPPIFRFLAQIFTLPNRRFYTPATDYERVPAELGLRPIPSMIDLPSEMKMSDDVDAKVTGRGRRGNDFIRSLKQRRAKNGNGDFKGIGITHGNVTNGYASEMEKNTFPPQKEVKHYDADVLTKVVVYTGIGAIATEWLPVMFQAIGWGIGFP